MDKPRILDIGCGSGVSTLELARLSRGEIIGIDIDQPALDKFTRKIKEAGLTDRLQAVNCSMFDMDFADEIFDIIWSEGSIYAIGFERGSGNGGDSLNQAVLWWFTTSKEMLK